MTESSRLQVSLEGLPPDQRFDYWLEKGSLYFRPSLIDPEDRSRFQMHGTMGRLGPLMLVRCGGSRQIYSREPSTICSDGNDCIMLDTLLGGSGQTWHNGHESNLAPGDLLLNDLCQPSRFVLEDHERFTAMIPRALILEVFPEVAEFHGSMIKRSDPFAHALMAHIEYLDQILDNVTPEASEPLAKGFIQLIATYFRASAPTWSRELSSSDQEDNQQLFSRILNYIDAHLNDSELSVDILISIFKKSRTSLYRLFEPHGGVAAVIRERRLQFAYRLLSKPLSADLKPPLIRDLALYLGFSSEAHFSRLFKARFGLTASQARHLQDAPPAPSSLNLLDHEGTDIQVDHYYQTWTKGLMSYPLPPVTRN
jgi:AraC-like DNA-binding protein